MPRPTTYDPEKLAEICQRLSAGEPLTRICADDHLPDPSTVWRWEKDATYGKEVAQAIARARELGEVALLEQCLEIADDEKHDWVMSKKGVITDEVAIGRAKLRIHTRLQLLAKFNPRKWGDKVEVEHKGQITLAAAVMEARKRRHGILVDDEPEALEHEPAGDLAIDVDERNEFERAIEDGLDD